MKILVGIAINILGALLIILSFTALAVKEETGWGTISTPNFPVFILGGVIAVAGGILWVWAGYQWQRKKAAEIIAEGIRKAQEKQQKK